MDLAKDLAWQKIFSDRSTNLKIEESGFFCVFTTFTLYFISFPDNQWTYEITTKNNTFSFYILRMWWESDIDVKWALNR